MRTARRTWWLAGVVAGLAGLATSYGAAMLLAIGPSPVAPVADLVIRLTPGAVVEPAISLLGRADKVVLVGIILLLTLALCGWAGDLAPRSAGAATLVFTGLAVLGACGVVTTADADVLDLVPVIVGYATWLLCLRLFLAAVPPPTDAESGAAPELAMPTETRRAVLLRAGGVLAASVLVVAVGRVVGGGRQAVEKSRQLLRLPGVSKPRVPAEARAGLSGLTPWLTPSADFYQIHTAVVVPTIDPAQWQLRIHGLVDRELVLSYDQLAARELREAWLTLNCVSNPIGGPLIGNAWWSGVPVAELLREAGVQAGADAVLQTSHDGWTCGTPLSALTDDRGAMLAIGMNGDPLPLEHGFPVRMVVPGLYGYVSACKWLVDLEVTTFDKFEAYWTTRGWAAQAPVKISSRIDVPRPGSEVPTGQVRVGGLAWAQHTGIAGVEVALDGGDWVPADLAASPSDDAWVQWTATLTLAPGQHSVRVRARDKAGLVQTGVQRDVLPDGATGWHTVSFSAAAG